jgi:hypothetical protein
MYKLNTELAAKADTIGAYINETGKYTGVLVRAEKLISSKARTDGIGFTFRADDGRECRFDLWTQKEGGEPLMGLNMVNAIMACLQVRQVTVTAMDVKKWHEGQETVMSAPCFTELMNKRIGFLLRAEEYAKMQDGFETGETGWRMAPFAVFQADTELMASEILKKKTQPEQLPKVIPMLADKPLKKKPGQRQSQPTSPSGGTSFAEMDDIPFSSPYRGKYAYAY